MAGNRTITKIIAFLLILVFSQKMGMSLYLHNWLHAVRSHSTASKPISGQELKFACGCINDITIPFTETAIDEIQVPLQTVNKLYSSPVVDFPAVYKFFHSLRAPPVI